MLSNESKQRYKAFWNNSAYTRACLHILVVKKDAEPFSEPKNLEQKWTDIDYRSRLAVHEAESCDYYADGFPNIFTNCGPGSLAGCIGSPFTLAPETIWFENEQIITDWDDTEHIKFNNSSEMYRLTDGLTDSLLSRGRDKFFTSVPDIGGIYDIIAALRGTQELLMDLYEYSEEIKEFVLKLQPMWTDYFNECSKKLMAAQGGAVTTWMPIYSEEPWYPIQCDFSAMISPDMFAEFVLPNLIYQTENMAHSVYHWDGPGELHHLDHLLSIERLNAIQWVPGDSNGSCLDEKWFEYFMRIQKAGKGLVLAGSDIDELERFLNKFSTKGVFINCWAEDERHAQEIIALVDSFGVK